MFLTHVLTSSIWHAADNEPDELMKHGDLAEFDESWQMRSQTRCEPEPGEELEMAVVCFIDEAMSWQADCGYDMMAAA